MSTKFDVVYLIIILLVGETLQTHVDENNSLYLPCIYTAMLSLCYKCDPDHFSDHRCDLRLMQLLIS